MRTVICIGWLVFSFLSVGDGARADTSDIPARLAEWWSLPFLERLHTARQALEAQRQPGTLDDGLEEYRAVIHCHSLLSHDSQGTLGELIAAAHATGTRVILMTEHPSRERDVYAEGWHGLRDGVLFIPGAETRNLILWPRTRKEPEDAPTRQAFVDAIRADDGLVFICHPDSFDEWDIRGVQGMEIYNIHADATDEPELRRLLGGQPDLRWLQQIARGYAKYPLESMAAIFDEPTEFVHRWDTLLQRGAVTGVAGNDAHQNTGFVFRAIAGPKLEIRSILDEPLAILDPEQAPTISTVLEGAKPGQEILRLQFDPYPISFRFVGTHVLAPELSEAAIRHALAAGHAFVAFDWLADARGFTAVAEAGNRRWPMGEQVPLQPGLRLRAEAPLNVRWRLVRNGNVVATAEGYAAEFVPTEPGVYRIEARLVLLGREWPWIYANPFYLIPSQP